MVNFKNCLDMILKCILATTFVSSALVFTVSLFVTLFVMFMSIMGENIMSHEQLEILAVTLALSFSLLFAMSFVFMVKKN